MKTKIFALATICLTLATGIIGCSDPADPSDATDDLYVVYKADEAELTDFSEVPTSDAVLAGTAFLKQEGPGQREFGQLTKRAWHHIIRQLELTDAQKEAIKSCFQAHRECAQADRETYRAARTARFTALKAEVAPIKAAYDSGSITKAEAKAQIEPILADYREDVKALNETLRTQLSDCFATLRDCVASNLTAEQLAKWNELISREG